MIPSEGSGWEGPPDSPKEKRLQRLIANSPWLVPGIDGEEATAVAEEVRVPGAGRADVIVVDAKGGITIVECKLAKNPEIRRWVIGQLYEYAAGLWKLDYTDFERSFAARDKSMTHPFKALPDWDEEEFRGAVSQNLASGAFRLVIAVDEASEGLKRAVTFLNSHTGPEVQLLAMELPLDSDGEHPAEPRIYGNNPSDIGPLQPSWKADRWTLMEGLDSEEAALVARELLDWAENQPELQVRYSQTDGPNPTTDAIVEVSGSTLFRIRRQREVRVSYEALTAHGEPWNEARIGQLVQELDQIGLRRERDRPRAPLEALADEDRRHKFLALMERVIGALIRPTDA